MVTEPNDRDLDALFAEARGAAPDAGLMARVLADADAVQDALAVPATPAPAPKTRWWRGALDAIGGWPVLSGATLAGVVGVAVGFYGFDTIDVFAGGWLTDVTGGSVLAPDVTALAFGS